MFICSFKLNKTRLLSGIAALCLALTLVFLMLPGGTESAVSGDSISGQSQEEMVDYLEGVGYTVTPNAVLIEQVTIPAVFDSKYEAYNELQAPAGFDLSQYMGQTAQKYTFKVLNYEDSSVEVVANLLVVDGKIIGGDISSTELGGFCYGLVTDKTEETSAENEQSTETSVDGTEETTDVSAESEGETTEASAQGETEGTEE